MSLWQRLRAWRDGRARREALERAACEWFREAHGKQPMGAHLLSEGPDGALVRVMYLAGHLPPSRAWCLVAPGRAPLERRWEDVKHLDTAPWR